MGVDKLVKLDRTLNISSIKHLCCIYDNVYDYTELITYLISIGLESNERILYSGDSENTNIILHHLSSKGINVEDLIDQNRLAINMFELKPMFDEKKCTENIIEMIDYEVLKASSNGFEGLKVIGEMSFAIACEFNSSQVIDHESKIESYVNSNNGCSIFSFFNKNIFLPAIILDILLTQKQVSVGTDVYENFNCIPKDNLVNDKRDKILLDFWIKNLKGRNSDIGSFKLETG